MIISEKVSEVRKIIGGRKNEGMKIGFVPTMGALHDGHLSLAKISRKHCDFTVMSIFVNKIQFNDPEDFSKYPRTLENDAKLAEKAGVDLIFTPDDSEMYEGQKTFIDMEELTSNLCGAHRPGHFRGVFTVVAKLFNIIQPDVAVFGQKDIQQAISLEKMVNDLNFPIKMIIAPIIREKDGLAMSSRNIRLSTAERKRELSIHKSLSAAETLIRKGEYDSEYIKNAVKKIITDKGSPDKIDYVEIVDRHNLEPVETILKGTILAVAAFFGNTRLIDNMIIEEGGKKCVY